MLTEGRLWCSAGVPDTPDAPDVAAALQAANARLRAENAELKAENAELKTQLAEQAEKIARLERLISRNSGNSSMPPSSDDLPGQKPPRKDAAGGEEAETRKAAFGVATGPFGIKITQRRLWTRACEWT